MPHRFRPRAVLFDLDGTVADTLADICVALDAARVAAGLAPVADPPRVRSWIGHGARALIARSLGNLPRDHPDVEDLLATFRGLYPGISGRHSTLFPGLREWITELRERGVVVGLATNKPHGATHAFLAAREATGLFDVVVTPDDVGDRTKPDPAMLLRAAERIGVAPAACVMIGDGDADIGAAHAAGMPVIAVLGGFGAPDALRALGADAYVEQTIEAQTLIG